MNYLEYLKEKRTRMAEENIELWNKLFPERKVKL